MLHTMHLLADICKFSISKGTANGYLLNTRLLLKITTDQTYPVDFSFYNYKTGYNHRLMKIKINAEIIPKL